MRIAIIGTGGVGGYLGAKLWKGGNDVVFVARGYHLKTMQVNGLKLQSPEGDLVIKSTFTDNLNKKLPFDLIIIAVKSFDTIEAAKIAKQGIDKDTMVISIQNGVENEDILAKFIGKEHVLAGVAYIFSTISEPGVIRHEGGTGKFKIGEMDGTISKRCLRLQETFHNAKIKCDIIEDIQRELWNKWIFICGLGGMTAYARKSIGEILSDSHLQPMLNQVVHEAASIARAKGIDRFEKVEEKAMTHYHRLPYPSTSSMYYDVTHNKRPEVEALNGAVVRFGKELNILTPANEKIYNSLKPYS